jgi:5-methylcytosine-specific restriction endonuclease McrA
VRLVTTVPNVHPPLLPAAIRAIRVTRAQFITAQHYDAWLVGMPVRRHLQHRKKFTRDERDLFRRHHEYLCSFCPATVMLTLDHVVPQVLGGSSREVNLRYACSRCNVTQWHQYAQYLRLLDRYLKAVAA